MVKPAGGRGSRRHSTPVQKQPRTDVHIVMNGTNIEQVTHKTFLGVTIDENLTWREHIKMVETKVSKSIAVLYKTMHVLDC